MRVLTLRSAIILQVLLHSTSGEPGQNNFKPNPPLAAPCATKTDGIWTTSDFHDAAAQCAEVKAQWNSSTYLANETFAYGSYQLSNWGTCLATAQGCNWDIDHHEASWNPNETCYQGNVPEEYVVARNVEDVRNALEVVSKGARLVVRNSGHDFMGRSAGAGALALIMTQYKSRITLLKDFIPVGCSDPVGDGVKVAAGHDWEEVYEFAEANDITVVGGSSRSVGAAGGWLTGGGNGFLSPTHGLGVDNALEISAVLANGTEITASRCQNRDVFFALAGGGGNAFGIITTVTYRAHPKVNLQVAFIAFATHEIDQFNRFISLITGESQRWTADGWGGYISLGLKARTGIAMLLFNPQLSLDEAKQSVDSAIQFARSKSLSAQTIAADVFTGGSFLQSYRKFLQPYEDASGHGVAISSRLLPTSIFNSPKKGLVDQVLAEIANNFTAPTGLNIDPEIEFGAPLQLLLVSPTQYTFPTGECANDTSVTPAWRKALLHVVAARGIPSHATVPEIQDIFRSVSQAIEPLRELTPTKEGGGAYLNEADVFEPQPEESFWGMENYEKLMKLKKELDPGNVLTCWNCVGWERENERFGCYPKI